MAAAPEYDPRYLAGVVLFNRGDFFEAHEVWESYWLSAEVGEHRRFIQGLIQAAVALHHLETGNERGARKLFATARNYMETYPEVWLGLDRVKFWQQMDERFAEAVHDRARDQNQREPCTVLTIGLEPPPSHWPDPGEFFTEDE